jgi:hypothetical protein
MPAMVVPAAPAATVRAASAGPVVRQPVATAAMSRSPATPRSALTPTELMWTVLVATPPAVPGAMAVPDSVALAGLAATPPFPLVMAATAARQQL